MTDGVDYFWSVIMSAGLVTDVPADNTLYGRYNGYWVAEPIQIDAPADGTQYVRIGNGWEKVPPFLLDAPVDDQYYSRLNGAWHVAPGGMEDAPADNTTYARYNAAWTHIVHDDIIDWDTTLASYALVTDIPIGATTFPIMDGMAAIGTAVRWARADHVHPTDTSRYSTSNPAGYVNAAQVSAAIVNYLPLAGGTLTGALILAGNPVGNLDAVPKQYVDTSVSNSSIDCGTF